MTNKQQSKVRFVRCPKCTKILPEPEHVPLYACGGCGAILQAKNYKGPQKNTALSSHEQDVLKRNGIVHACDAGESSGSSRRSSSDHSSAQEEIRNSDDVGNSRNAEQNGAVDNSSLPNGSSFFKNKENGEIDDIKSEKNFSKLEQNEVADSSENISLSRESNSFKNQENGEIGNSKSEESCSKSEHNGFANYVHRTALSEEPGCTENKENGDIGRKIDQFDSKGRGANDHPALLENEPQKLTRANSVIEDDNGQGEECNGIVIEKLHLKQIGGVNSDRETFTREESMEDDDDDDDDEHEEKLVRPVKKQTGGVNSDRETFIREESIEDDDDDELEEKLVRPVKKQIGGVNSDRETFVRKESIEDDDDDDELEEKLIRHVKSTKEACSSTESAAIENPAEHHASIHELSEKTGKMHLEGRHTHDDRNEQNQIGYMLSAKDASSWTESPGIEKTTQFASENPAENDASEHQLSKDIKISHLVEEHSHQDVLRNKIVLHELDEPEVAISGKEYGNGTDPMEDASSLSESPELTQLASEIPGKHYAFDHELSKEASKMHHEEAHVQQDIAGNGINRLDTDGAEVQKSSMENGNWTDPDAIAEQLESVQISNAPSLSTFIQGGNDDLRISTPSVTDMKTFYKEGPTNVSESRVQKNSFDSVKRTSKKNIENVGKSAVYKDRKVGTFSEEIPESSSKRSPAYDGSVSSFDGNDEKVPEQPPQVSEEPLTPNNAIAGSDGAEESPERDSLRSARMIFGNIRPPRQARSSSSMVLDEKFKRRMIEEEAPLEQNGIPRRFRPNRENFLPWGPNRRRSSEMTYETGSTSSYALPDEPLRHRMHPHHPYGSRVPEAPLWTEKEFLPMYYNSEASGEFYDRPKHHSYMDRRRRTESWSRSGTLPRNLYSGEISNERYPYMHRYPEDRRWSAQLPPPATYFHQGGYMNPGWETRWDPYDSYPTSPQRYMESESSCAWPHETISLSDDPRHKDQIMRQIYLREKRQGVKTPFYPIAGGTPFINCYFCFNILQLPQNFLRSRRRQRRAHKLRCGACSRVLEFSLENEGGLAPYETNLNRNVNLAMSSHSHANHSRQSSVNSADGSILLSRDSFRASNREKRMSGVESSSKGEKMVGPLDDDDAPPVRGRSSKVTWQLPARSKSPLHKLMGYASPKEMLTFHEDDVE